MVESMLQLLLSLDVATQSVETIPPVVQGRKNLYGMSWEQNVIIGALIGSTIAGVLAHSLNYSFRISNPEHNIILTGYAVILSVGLYNEYGTSVFGEVNPLLIIAPTFVGVFILGRVITHLFKSQLPRTPFGEPGGSEDQSDSDEDIEKSSQAD